MIFKIIGLVITVTIVFWLVYSCFGPAYVKCECGNIVRLDITSNLVCRCWECENCKRSGKIKLPL